MTDADVSRRAVLLGAVALGALTVPVLPEFTPRAAAATMTKSPATPVPADQATTLWYTSPGTESTIISTGLPIGNGRIGAMLTGDTADEAYYVTDVTCWAGNANASLGSDGQFSYDTTNFGTQQMLATAYLAIPAHTSSAISGYRRQLDLSNGYTSATYTYDGVTYRRDVWASHPDDVIVIHLSQSGGGSYTGTLTLTGTRSETTTTNASAATASFTGSLSNGLKYAALVQGSDTGTGSGGSVRAAGSAVSFTNCTDVVLVISGGTNYSATAPGFMDSHIVPLTVATGQASRAVSLGAPTLLGNHLADYQALQQTMSINLGASTAAQRALPTDQRLAAAYTSGADPELHAAYVQFGRYLMISGSRTSLPINLQGPWQNSNSPDWMSDYHTDINVEMVHWLPDRTGLGALYEPLVDYLVSQVPVWEKNTKALFNTSTNGFRNTSGKVAGWTTAISANPFGGLGWWWHPAGNAWLCHEIYSHFQYTQDGEYLAKIYPLLKGACEFWEARLITTTWTDSNNVTHTVLVDDHDWSPEHGPTDAIGITYAQELVWQLFADYREAAALTNQDAAYAATVASLQAQLYLPQVSPLTGWLEEWMTPDNLDTSDIQHRHLSPLIGLYPGDRITADQSPAALLTGVTNLLTARGMTSYGWGVAWRSICWSRLKNAANAYTCFTNGLTPSVNGSTGASGNFMDIYSGQTYQIDANMGLPSAVIEMLVYTRPGLLQLLPALPVAWSASGSVTGIGVRGGLTVGFTWQAGQVTSVTLHNIGAGAASLTIESGAWSKSVTVPAGQSVTYDTFVLVNRNSGKAIDDPAASTVAGAKLIQYAVDGGTNQSWQFKPTGVGAFSLINGSSGLAMDVEGGGTADGAVIDQWTATGATNQQWKLSDAGSGYVNLVSVRSGKVVGVVGSSAADLANLEQETLSSSATNQQWQLKLA